MLPPFGMLMEGRKYSSNDSYRYGFNGKQNDNEVKGEGNQQDYGMRVFDTRIGRFLSEDPITKNYPFYCPYQFASNSPILAVDIDGMESSVQTNNNETSTKSNSSPSEPSNSGTSGWIKLGQILLDAHNGKLQTDIVIGAGAAVKDATVGACKFLISDMWKPKTYVNLTKLLITISNFDKPELLEVYDETFGTDLKEIYSGLKEKLDVTKWTAKDWSYNLTSLAIAIYGPKVAKDFRALAPPRGLEYNKYINLASEERTLHILAGDATGGGHSWTASIKSFTNGITGTKSMFPASWNNAKIMHAISDVVVNNPWKQVTGRAGEMFTKSGYPVKFEVIGKFEGRTIKVITTHTDIITAYPLK